VGQEGEESGRVEGQREWNRDGERQWDRRGEARGRVKGKDRGKRGAGKAAAGRGQRQWQREGQRQRQVRGRENGTGMGQGSGTGRGEASGRGERPDSGRGRNREVEWGEIKRKLSELNPDQTEPNQNQNQNQNQSWDQNQNQNRNQNHSQNQSWDRDIPNTETPAPSRACPSSLFATCHPGMEAVVAVEPQGPLHRGSRGVHREVGSLLLREPPHWLPVGAPSTTPLSAPLHRRRPPFVVPVFPLLLLNLPTPAEAIMRFVHHRRHSCPGPSHYVSSFHVCSASSPLACSPPLASANLWLRSARYECWCGSHCCCPIHLYSCAVLPRLWPLQRQPVAEVGQCECWCSWLRSACLKVCRRGLPVLLRPEGRALGEPPGRPQGGRAGAGPR